MTLPFPTFLVLPDEPSHRELSTDLAALAFGALMATLCCFAAQTPETTVFDRHEPEPDPLGMQDEEHSVWRKIAAALMTHDDDASSESEDDVHLTSPVSSPEIVVHDTVSDSDVRIEISEGNRSSSEEVLWSAPPPVGTKPDPETLGETLGEGWVYEF